MRDGPVQLRASSSSRRGLAAISGEPSVTMPSRRAMRAARELCRCQRRRRDRTLQLLRHELDRIAAICRELAETAMAGIGAKVWRAFRI
jgi:hypothetical protein